MNVVSRTVENITKIAGKTWTRRTGPETLGGAKGDLYSPVGDTIMINTNVTILLNRINKVSLNYNGIYIFTYTFLTHSVPTLELIFTLSRFSENQ